MEKGKKLYTGRGVENMLNICYRRKWSRDNTIIEIDDTNDLDSRFTIYAKA